MRRIVGTCLLAAVLAAPAVLRWVTEPPLPPIQRAPAVVASNAAQIPPDFVTAPLRFLSLAPVDSLEQLPGIGPVLAERIASARSGRRLFTRWEDLLAVEGIGPKRLAGLRAAAEPAE